MQLLPGQGGWGWEPAASVGNQLPHSAVQVRMNAHSWRILPTTHASPQTRLLRVCGRRLKPIVGGGEGARALLGVQLGGKGVLA